jgi:C-terminal processing protease CtpA/Prc
MSTLVTRARPALLLSLLGIALAAGCTEPVQPPPPPPPDFDADSGIESQALTPVQVDNLALLARVWGFAKYHHPRVTSGQEQWDFALFEVVPRVLAAPDRASAASALSAWLAALGEIAPCSPCASLPANPHLVPDLAWIGDAAGLGQELSARLALIHRNRPAGGEQHYVEHMQNVGNPAFPTELPYANHSSPDAGYRLLALFRYWNIIAYWFPYRDVMDAEWYGVLREFIPLMMEETDADGYRLKLMRLIARIDDTHAFLEGQGHLVPPTGSTDLPVVVRFVGGQAVVRGLYSEVGPATGLRVGDVIEQIDGVPAATLIALSRPFYSASNEDALLRKIASRLTRGEGAAVVSGFGAEGAFTLTAQRERNVYMYGGVNPTHDLPGPAFRMLGDEVAYLKLSSVVGAQVSAYVEQALGAKVLVIDIRNYPSDFVVFSLGGHLVAAPTPFARFTKGDASNPGAFAWTEPVVIAPRQPRFTGRVVILVDETTQSSAEYHAMGYRRAPGAIVVGSTTAGADGNVSRIPLPGGLSTIITGIGVFYPDGSPTQRVGIVPDLEVRPTIAGIRGGRDEVLEAGVSQALGREFRLSGN